MPQVSVSILGSTTGTLTNDSGFFSLKVPAGKALALLIFLHRLPNGPAKFYTGRRRKRNHHHPAGTGGQVLEEVMVKEQRGRTEAGLIRLNPKSVLNLPTPVMGVESLIKIFVGSNNELTSQYNVRGGSYDENLIYVNDFEIFRPYLSTQRSTGRVKFYKPGHGAQYQFLQRRFSGTLWR